MLRLVVPVALLAFAGAGCGALLDFDPPDPDAGSAADLGSPDGGHPVDAGMPDAMRPDASRPDGGCTEDRECDDGLFCDGQEHCSMGACVTSPVPACDGTGCAHGFCSTALNACDTMPDDTLCMPSEFCTRDGSCVRRPTCSVDGDCLPMAPPCFDGTCGVGGTCNFAPRDCGPSTAGCAVVGCDPAMNHCVATPIDSLCPDDGIGCTIETCHIDSSTRTGACTSMPSPDPTDCDDGLDCTVDRCDPSGCTPDPGGCTHVANNSACAIWASSLTLPPAFGLCTNAVCAPGVSGSDTTSGCVFTPVCPTSGCSAMTGAAICTSSIGHPCAMDDECNDGNPCDGNEVCGGGGTCMNATAIGCVGGGMCAISSPTIGAPIPICLPLPIICGT